MLYNIWHKQKYPTTPANVQPGFLHVFQAAEAVGCKGEKKGWTCEDSRADCKSEVEVPCLRNLCNCSFSESAWAWDVGGVKCPEFLDASQGLPSLDYPAREERDS